MNDPDRIGTDAAAGSVALDLGDWFGWAIVELAPDGIAVTNEGGQILMVNRALAHVFGYGATELVGRRVEHLMPMRFRAAHLGHRHDYDDAPTSRSMGIGRSLTGLRSDGTEFPIEVSLSPIATAAGMRTVVIIRDRTDQIAAEANEGSGARATAEQAIRPTY